MHRIRHRASALLFLLLAACSAPVPHVSVPEKEVSEAVVEGFPADIRSWADEAPRDFGNRLAARIKLFTAKYKDYYAKHGEYPDLHYLAISGGAYDGAFAAGLLTGWEDGGARPNFAMVTGISTGALIAPFVFIGPQYDEEMMRLFTTTNTDAIFMTSVADVIDGLTGGLAVTDSTPLYNSIKRTVTKKVMEEIAEQHRIGKRLYIGTTNIEAQRGVIWDIGAIANSGNPKSLKLIHKIMLASASIPGAFKPVFIDVEAGGKKYSEIHADGGVTSQVFAYPIKIRHSVLDIYQEYKLKRHLYIIRNSKISPEYKSMEPGFFGLTRRSVETLIKYHGLGDLYRLYVSCQRDGIDYNLAYIPDSFLLQPKEIFDPAYMKNLFDLGYKMGKEGVRWEKTPPGVEYIPD